MGTVPEMIDTINEYEPMKIYNEGFEQKKKILNDTSLLN